MRAPGKIVLGTRGSDLARAQTALVERALQIQFSRFESEVRIITTRGDEKNEKSEEPLDRRAGRKGLFTSEIERALLAGEIDVAVHSAKDLPSHATAGLEIIAALPRAPFEDVLVSKNAAAFTSLPEGATVATGSVRRQHQLRWRRPDVNVRDLRGNVPTRLRKLAAENWEGIILARAGLERLGLECLSGELAFGGQAFGASVLPVDEFLPAGGQGIVALQARSDDEETRDIIRELNHSETLLCLRAEREFLRLLQGDCGTPVAVLAGCDGATLRMHAQLFEEGRAEPRTAELQREATPPERVAAELLALINGR